MAEHPFVRLRASKGLTQEALADSLLVTRHYYIRIEQGLYHDIPVGLLTGLSMRLGVTEAELTTLYREYQKETRIESSRTFRSFKKVLFKYNGLQHPLVYYRSEENLTRMGLCKAFCLHYDGVTQYEANRQRGVPLDLKLACGDMYWDYSYLESSVAEWRISGRADRAAKKSA